MFVKYTNKSKNTIERWVLSMKEVHLIASFYMVLNTHKSKEEILEELDPDTLISSEIQLITPDGEIHKTSLANCLKLKYVDHFEYESDKKKMPLRDAMAK